MLYGRNLLLAWLGLFLFSTLLGLYLGGEYKNILSTRWYDGEEADYRV